MKIENLVASKINTFEEIDLLKEELKKLPPDYEPFPSLDEKSKIGSMLFGDSIVLSPISKTGEKPYTGSIKIPDGSSNILAQDIKGDRGIIIGAQFNYKERVYVIHRTDVKHNNP